MLCPCEKTAIFLVTVIYKGLQLNFFKAEKHRICAEMRNISHLSVLSVSYHFP